MKVYGKKWKKKFGHEPIHMFEDDGIKLLALLGITSAAHVRKLSMEMVGDSLEYTIVGGVDKRLLGKRDE
jgi:hypothetical protein